MKDPRISALICGLVAVWLGYQIFMSAEAPSQILAVLQWFFFLCAIAGFAAAMVRLLRR